MPSCAPEQGTTPLRLQLAMSPTRYRLPPYSPPDVCANGFLIDWYAVSRIVCGLVPTMSSPRYVQILPAPQLGPATVVWKHCDDGAALPAGPRVSAKPREVM